METIETIHPPISSQAPQNPPKNLAEAVRNYLKARRIWETIGNKFVLNDEVSRQIRKDTQRFRIEPKHWLGV